MKEFFVIHSSDKKFLFKLIDWLSKQNVDSESTTIRHQAEDPFEIQDMLQGQIDGMKIRIMDLEKRT